MNSYSKKKKSHTRVAFMFLFTTKLSMDQSPCDALLLPFYKNSLMKLV